mmetsp:Transcript_13367/g.14666  ORF Transcript_13367/g.14666 Transcript_13367/m.14666 type:complete len:171 (+) Transcript_13367:147-659(+)
MYYYCVTVDISSQSVARCRTRTACSYNAFQRGRKEGRQAATTMTGNVQIFCVSESLYILYMGGISCVLMKTYYSVRGVTRMANKKSTLSCERATTERERSGKTTSVQWWTVCVLQYSISDSTHTRITTHENDNDHDHCLITIIMRVLIVMLKVVMVGVMVLTYPSGKEDM